MSNVEGLDKLLKTIDGLRLDSSKYSVDANIAGGKLVESDAKRSIQSRSGGKIVNRYRNGGASYSHQVSKAGDAPNTDTGKLVSSINTEVQASGVFVGTTIDYGKHLEFGTTDMVERPWLIPALNGRKDDIISLQIGAVNKAIKGASHGV